MSACLHDHISQKPHLPNSTEVYVHITVAWSSSDDNTSCTARFVVDVNGVYRVRQKKVAPQSFLPFSRQLFGVLSNFFYKFIY